MKIKIDFVFLLKFKNEEIGINGIMAIGKMLDVFTKYL